MPLDSGLIDRFIDKIIVTDSCWLWAGAKGPAGYGKLRETTPSRATQSAHRVSYEFFVGPIPDGLQIDHLCRTPNCVNPAHLEPVTQRENMLRGVGPAAIRAARTHCPAGHAYDEANTYIYKRMRHCRKCRAKRERRRYHRMRLDEAVTWK